MRVRISNVLLERQSINRSCKNAIKDLYNLDFA